MRLEINKDISKYRMTIKGYTPRGIICTFLILAISITIMVGLYDYLTTIGQLALIAVCCAPIAFFYLEEVPLYSLPTEKIIRVMMIYALSPKKSKVENVDMFNKRKRDNPLLAYLNRHKFNIPRSVQDFVPLDCFYEDGMAKAGNRYSVLYRFSDVDFSVLSDDDKETVLEKYESIISTFLDKASYKITVASYNIPQEVIYSKMALPNFNYNPALSDSINGQIHNNIAAVGQSVTGLYLTVSILQNTEEDAVSYFELLTNNLYSKFSEIGSICCRVNLRDRLSLYHFLNNQNSHKQFEFTSIKDLNASDIRLYCCPEMWRIHSDYIELGSSVCRSFYMESIEGTSIPDTFYRNMLKGVPNLSFASLEMECLSKEEAKKQVSRAITDTQSKLSKYRQDKAKSGDVSSYAPPELVDEGRACSSMYQDIAERNQNLYMATILVVITAPDKETLEKNTRAFFQEAKANKVNFNISYHQQVQCLFSCLPYGISNPIEVRRMMTTESIAAFVPLSEQVVRHYGPKALWEGRNPITKKVNSINRDNLPNGNGMIFGDSGSGKSVQAKLDIIQRRIKEPESEILIVDPKGEYHELGRLLGGLAVNISVSSTDHINLMEISKGYGTTAGKDSIKSKVSFVQSVVQNMCAGEVSTTSLNSIVDRCATRLYKKFMNGQMKEQPTLQDLYYELSKEKKDEAIAKQIATAIETYSIGSLNVFAQQTNIPEDNGLIVFDIHNLEDSFRDLGLMVMLDQVINRVAQNRAKGIYTYIYIDEFHKFFNTPAEPLLMDLWKMGRAMHCFSTGITQNIVEVLNNENGQLIAHNSEYLKILKLNRMEIIEDLSRVIFIPHQLITYISGLTNNGDEKLRRSTGLIKYGTTIIPFESQIPHESYLYQLINSD